MFTRRDAIAAVLAALGDEAAVVSANGMISRESFAAGHPRSFPMIGSMGLAAAVGLGVASARPDREVAVLDGDGNALMGLAVLPMVGARRPCRLLHVVLDNGVYGSTGGQPSLAGTTDLVAAALACGYAGGADARSAEGIVQGVRRWRAANGPWLLRAVVEPDTLPPAPRVGPDPPALAATFGRALGAPP